MTDESTSQPVMFLGRDLRKVPCLRKSFLYGISGGLTCGLFAFLFTSHPSRSANFAMGSYIVITLAYWVNCRLNYIKLRNSSQAFRSAMHQATILEGTEKGPVLPEQKEFKTV